MFWPTTGEEQKKKRDTNLTAGGNSGVCEIVRSLRNCAGQLSVEAMDASAHMPSVIEE
jgi:hypothetical protein